MPVGFDGVLIVWAALLLPLLLPPVLSVLFFWRTPRPKTLAVLLSSAMLYPVLWASAEAIALLMGGVYAPIVLSLLVGWVTLVIARAFSDV